LTTAKQFQHGGLFQCSSRGRRGMVVDTLTVKLPYIDYHAQLVAVCQTCYEHGINGIRKNLEPASFGSWGAFHAKIFHGLLSQI